MTTFNATNSAFILTNVFNYSCPSGMTNLSVCLNLSSANLTQNCSASNQIAEVEGTNQTDCNLQCIVLLNSSGVCQSSCPQYTYVQRQFSNCLSCQSAYDNGAYFSRSSSSCVSSCKFWSDQTLNLTYYTICEAINDPPDGAHCPYLIINASYSSY